MLKHTLLAAALNRFFLDVAIVNGSVILDIFNCTYDILILYIYAILVNVSCFNKIIDDQIRGKEETPISHGPEKQSKYIIVGREFREYWE